MQRPRASNGAAPPGARVEVLAEADAEVVFRGGRVGRQPLGFGGCKRQSRVRV